METVVIKIVQLLLSLSLLIILHEGGHFLFSKLFKVRVEKFYLFFDAWNFSLFKYPRKKKSEDQTEYGIGWLPLGGYVKISGMIDESMDKEQMAKEPQPWEFRTKPAWQRLLIMLGGVIVNFIVAFIIYSMVLFVWGEQYIKPTDMTYGLKFNAEAKAHGFQDGDQIFMIDNDTVEAWSVALVREISNAKTVTVKRGAENVTLNMPENMNMLTMLEEPRYVSELIPMCVDTVIPGTPAETIGLKKGDAITSINGTAIADHNELLWQMASLRQTVDENSIANDSLNARTVSLVINGTDTVTAVLSPDFTLGFVSAIPDYKVSKKEYGFFESIPAGIAYGCETLAGYVNDLKYVFTKEGSKQVGGFVAIGNIFPSVWDWRSFWTLTALLSIILGFMNVLPIPALDGGHAVFAIYEIVTGRKPSEKFLERAQLVGMIILFGLLIFANMNDILRLIGVY